MAVRQPSVLPGRDPFGLHEQGAGRLGASVPEGDGLEVMVIGRCHKGAAGLFICAEPGAASPVHEGQEVLRAFRRGDGLSRILGQGDRCGQALRLHALQTGPSEHPGQYQYDGDKHHDHQEGLQIEGGDMLFSVHNLFLCLILRVPGKPSQIDPCQGKGP